MQVDTDWINCIDSDLYWNVHNYITQSGGEFLPSRVGDPAYRFRFRPKSLSDREKLRQCLKNLKNNYPKLDLDNPDNTHLPSFGNW